MKISCSDPVESTIMDLEIVQRENRGKPNKLTLFETKKIQNEVSKMKIDRQNQLFLESI